MSDGRRSSASDKEVRDIRTWIRTYVVPHRTKSIGSSAPSAYWLKHVAAKLIPGRGDHYRTEQEFIELLELEGVKVNRHGKVGVTRSAAYFLDVAYCAWQAA